MKFCFSMIDCHCHLLPAVDDGSQSLEETLAVLREVRRQEHVERNGFGSAAELYSCTGAFLCRRNEK